MMLPAAAILVGLFLLAWCGLPLAHHASADYAVPVRALVVESTTLPAGSVVDRIWPRHVFAYRYLYQGELYLGQFYRQRGGAREAVRRYPVGATVTAWVDSEQPEKAVIETGISRADLILLVLGLALLLVGLLKFFRLPDHDSAAVDVRGKAGNR